MIICKKRVFKNAWRLAKAGMGFPRALSIAWCKAKIAVATTVTFAKKDGTVTTRQIAKMPVVRKTTAPRTVNQMATVKVIDAAKVEAGLPLHRCIISFHASQVISFK